MCWPDGDLKDRNSSLLLNASKVTTVDYLLRNHQSDKHNRDVQP